MRAVVTRVDQVQTYRCFVTLECGHRTTYTVSAAKRHDPKAHPKTTGCSECPGLPRPAAPYSTPRVVEIDRSDISVPAREVKA